MIAVDIHTVSLQAIAQPKITDLKISHFPPFSIHYYDRTNVLEFHAAIAV